MKFGKHKFNKVAISLKVSEFDLNLKIPLPSPPFHPYSIHLSFEPALKKLLKRNEIH